MPGLIERIGTAATIAKAALTRDPKVAWGMLAEIHARKEGPPPPPTGDELLKLILASPILRMMLYRIAASTASATWRLEVAAKAGSAAYRLATEVRRAPSMRERGKVLAKMRKAGDLRTVDEKHPFLDQFLAGPMAGLYGSEKRRLLQIHLDAIGESFLGLVRNSFGVPVGFVPIVPSWVKATPTGEWEFYRLEYGRWRPAPVPAADILWMRDPNPRMPYGRGHGIGQTLADELVVDELGSKHMAAELRRQGVPPLLVAMPGLQKAQKDDLEYDLIKRRANPYTRHLPYFLQAPAGAANLWIERLAQDFSSEQVARIRESQRELCAQVFNMPPELVGMMQNSNRATSDNAEYNFGKHVTTPRLEVQREVFAETIIPEYDERLILSFDPVIDEDRDYRLRSSAAFPHTATVDEIRQDRGEEPLGAGNGGDLVRVRRGEFFVPVSELPEEPAELESAPGAATPEASFAKSVVKATAVDIFEQVLAELAGPMADAYIAAIADEVAGVTVEQLTAAAAAGPDAVLQQVAFAIFEDAYGEAAGEMMLEAVEAAGEIAGVAIGAEGLNIGALAQQWAREHAASFVQGVSKASKTALRDAVVRALDETSPSTRDVLIRELRQHIGLDQNQSRHFEKFMRETIDNSDLSSAKVQQLINREHARLIKVRAERIATHEIRTATSHGQREMWKRAQSAGRLSKKATKRWRKSSNDDEPECNSLDGQERKIGQRYQGASGRSYDYPPQPHVGCQCREELVIPKE